MTQSPIPQAILDDWQTALDEYSKVLHQFKATPLQNAFFAGMAAGVIPQLIAEIKRLKENS